jgi:hypothetical protein
MIDEKSKSASRGEISLYCYIGEAVCMIQLLEGALSTSITLKKDVRCLDRISKQEADDFRKKNYKFTLGDAISLAKKNNLYSAVIVRDLEDLKEERNWLIHRLLHENLEAVHAEPITQELFHRVKAISNKAKMLKETIETDLVEFSELQGVNMSRVRECMKQHFSDN